MLTTDLYFMICKNAGLTVDEMSMFTIGGCLDYAITRVEEHEKMTKKEKEEKVTKVTSVEDFRKFF